MIKRQGWRGPITNKKNNPNWKKKLKQFKNRSYVKLEICRNNFT